MLLDPDGSSHIILAEQPAFNASAMPLHTPISPDCLSGQFTACDFFLFFEKEFYK
jgi:hypothetical protein